MPELTAYQDAAYADAYCAFVENVRAREAEVAGGDLLARTVAANLFKLAAYKDEYEVARLSLDPALTERIERQFGRGARYAYRLHPPVLRSLGMRRKISLGPWFRPAFATLVAMRRLRGTALDPFGRTEVRREERALLAEYRDAITRLAEALTADNHALGRSRSPACPTWSAATRTSSSATCGPTARGWRSCWPRSPRAASHRAPRVIQGPFDKFKIFFSNGRVVPRLPVNWLRFGDGMRHNRPGPNGGSLDGHGGRR